MKKHQYKKLIVRNGKMILRIQKRRKYWFVPGVTVDKKGRLQYTKEALTRMVMQLASSNKSLW